MYTANSVLGAIVKSSNGNLDDLKKPEVRGRRWNRAFLLRLDTHLKSALLKSVN